MAAVLFQVPYTSVVVNGLPVPNAKLYFSTTLTITPLAAFTTAALNVPHPSPVRSSASGRLPDIYLDGSKTYRLRIYDKNNELLEDIDPFIPGTIPAAGALQPYQTAAETAASTAGSSAAAAAVSATSAQSAYQSIASSANAIAHAADRSALASLGSSVGPVYLRESGREGTFTWSSANLSAHVTADTAKGLYVAPTSDTTGASGAWIRKFSGSIDLGWFGLVEGDNSANAATNAAAVASLKAVLVARKLSSSGNSPGIERFRIPYGTYWIGGSVADPTVAFDFTNAVIIDGCSVGYSAGSPLLKFPAGVTGMRFQDIQTSGFNTKDGAIHNGAQGSIVNNVTLYGAFTTAEAEAHGIQARTTVRLNNVHAKNFEGDGFYLSASNAATSGSTPPQGNVDTSTLINCTANDNRRGLFIDGTDANAITVIQFNANTNRWAGIYDSALIHNSYFGGQHAGNGKTSDNNGTTIPASECSDGTNRYCVILGQETGASTNAPSGTTADNTWWYYLGAGGTTTGCPLWVTGMSWRAGGAVICDEISGSSCFYGVYSETAGPKSQMVQRTFVSGGTLAEYLFENTANNRRGTSLRSTTNGILYTTNPFQVDSGTVTSKLGAVGSNSSTIVLSGNEPTYSPLGHQLRFANLNGGSLLLTYSSSTSVLVYSINITGPNTTEQFGTGAAVPNALYAPRLMVGASTTGARQINIDTAAPTTGAHGQGEVVFNRNATVGSPKGWQCTAAGTPGTWVSMGNL